MRERIEAELARHEAAMRSLVAFRETFCAAPGDVAAAPFHHRWSEVLLHGRGHFAVEAFRESAKTQIVVRANLLHAIAYPMAHRSYIALICATQGAASKRLREIGRTVRAKGNEAIADMVAACRSDSATAFEVECRNGVGVRIEAFGKGSAVRGLSWGAKRPDLVIVDDPQDAEDARSEAVTEADWEWFLSDVLFLGQGSRIFLIGNNLGERCIIERAMHNAERLGFAAERLPILDGEGRPTWPARHDAAKILAEKEAFAAMGKADIWHREKMCRVVAPDSQVFRREYFSYYEPAMLETAGMSVYMAVDPAASEKERADRTAVCVVGVNGAGHWFVLDHWAERARASEAMDAIFRLVAKWRPLAVGIESVAYQAALEDFLRAEMPRRNLFFNIRKLQAVGRKELRIETALQPRFAARSIWLPAMTSWAEEIERELLAFPHGRHDDRIDALAYIDRIAVVPADAGWESGEMICDI